MGLRLVFVHGIGGHRDVAAQRDLWLRALVTGLGRAGHPDLAARFGSDEVAVEFAYYGPLFDSPGAQGVGGAELDPEAAELLAGYLRELIEAQRQRGPESSRRQLAHAQAQLAPEGQAQGVGDVIRRLLNAATTLLGVGPIQQAGQWAAGRLMVRDLAQVTRYLTRREPDPDGTTLDQRIRARVRDSFGEGPVVVVAHSLGTVVALEALHEYREPVPLFVTLGSPIGMRTVVWPRLLPQPPRTPASVRRWVNAWDRDDVIAVRPVLAGVAPNQDGVQPEDVRTDSDGLWVHSAEKYLSRSDVAGPIAQAMTATAGPRR